MIENRKISYSELFWLFMAGSLLGVLIEGIFCLFHYGHWETHTVAIFGPFCIIYGIGAVIFYVGSILMKDRNKIFQFIIFAVSATIIEYICGALLKYGLGMRAWNYSRQLFNIDGLICLKFTVIWGLGGVLFSIFAVRRLKNIFDKMHSKKWNISCFLLSIFMTINFTLTSFCIIRWAERHYGILPRNSIEQYIDENWNDNIMQKRFCEWKFIENP